MGSYIPYYPGIKPQQSLKTRATLGLASAALSFRGKRGTFCTIDITRKDGVMIYHSKLFELNRDFPEIMEIVVPAIRSGYSVWFTYYYQGPGELERFQHRKRYPFDLIYKDPAKKDGPALIVIKGRGSVGLQQAVRTARLRQRRDDNLRLRRDGHHTSPLGAKTAFGSVARWSCTNNVCTFPAADVYLAYDRSASGTTTPSYVKRKKSGTLPINAYSMSLYECSDGGYGIDTWTSNGSGSVASGGGAYASQLGTSVFGGTAGSPPPSSSADFRAQRKLREKLGPSNNIAQDFAQFYQVSNLIGNNLTRIAKSVMALRQGNLAESISTLWHGQKPVFRRGKHPRPENSIADNWLMMQYGWKPLLEDIHGVMESLKRYNLADETVYTIRSSATNERHTHEPGFLNVAGPRTYTGAKGEIAQTTVRYGLRYRVANRLKVFLQQTGFTNPASLAWEVLPWSFVVDWALPIGPWIDSFTSYSGLEFIDGWKSIVTEVITDWNTSYCGKLNVSDPNDVQMISYYGTLRKRSVTYARTRLIAFPTSPVPEPKNPITMTHAANGLALLVSAFNKPISASFKKTLGLSS